MKLPLSVIVHTRNSAKTLEQALKSVEFAQELVVIDMESKDASVEIAKKYGAKIFQHKDVGYVEPARMFGIQKASHDWVLVLDADEEIQSELVRKIPQLISGQESGWQIPRKNLMFGVWPKHAAWWPDYVVRLFRKDKIDWPKTIHAQPIIDGMLGKLEPLERIAILHRNYESVSDYVARINHYTTIKTREQNSNQTNSLHAFFADFLSKYLSHQGYKDGVLGLNLSMLQAMYESVLAIKVWEARGKKETALDPSALLSQLIQDMAYWRADYHIHQSSGPKRLFWQLRRKFKI